MEGRPVGKVWIGIDAGTQHHHAAATDELPGELIVAGGWLERFATQPLASRGRT